MTIARMFLCNPSILILDEATSNVDTRTEKEISRAMNQLTTGKASKLLGRLFCIYCGSSRAGSIVTKGIRINCKNIMKSIDKAQESDKVYI